MKYSSNQLVFNKRYILKMKKSCTLLYLNLVVKLLNERLTCWLQNKTSHFNCTLKTKEKRTAWEHTREMAKELLVRHFLCSTDFKQKNNLHH